ncbi:MAG: NfeD family protein [Sulfurovum sp.]|nr:NfeD family protein [Sulfurovum sp.]
MITLFNETIMWWHWIVLGIILLILEMNSGTFLMLGLGVAAVFVGIVDVLADTSFATDISIWMILSTLSIAAWFKWVKGATVSKTGQSSYALDTTGTVTEDIEALGRGEVIFDTPVLGNSTWHATSKKSLAEGSRVKIVDINGQLIEVQKI